MTRMRLADLVPDRPQAQGPGPGGQRARNVLLLLAVPLVVAGAFLAGRYWPDPPSRNGGSIDEAPADQSESTVTSPAAQGGSGPQQTGPVEPPRSGPAVTVLHVLEKGRRVPVVAVTADAGQGVHLILPTRYLPEIGELSASPDGPPLPLRWVGLTEDLPRPDGARTGSAMLWLERIPAENGEWGVLRLTQQPGPLRVGARIWPLAGPPDDPRRGAGDGVVVAADGNGGFRLAAAMEHAIAFVDETGQPIAWTGDGQQLEPLAAAWRFLPRGGPQALTFQEGLTAWLRTDPRSLLMAAQEMLGGAAPADVMRQTAQDLEVAAARVGGDLHDRVVAAIAALAERLVAAQPEPYAALAEARQWAQRYPTNANLLILALSAALNANAPDDALQHFDALRTHHPASAKGVLASLVAGLLSASQQALEAGDPGRAQWLAQMAIERDPASGAARARFAQALWAAGQQGEAAMAAQKAAELDPRWASLARDYKVAQAEVRGAGPGRVELPFDPARGTVLATVQVQGRSMQMVFDTGASLTTIPRSMAQAARIDLRGAPMVQINTAGGVVQAPRITIPELRIGSLVLRNIGAVVLDLPGDLSNAGLLGLNAIGQLRVTIDRSRGRLLLETL